MPLDAVCLLATVREIHARTAEGRIDKIYQPERDEIVLSIRLMRGSVKLLLSAGAGSPRMHFIEKGRENPSAPCQNRVGCIAGYGAYGDYHL